MSVKRVLVIGSWAKEQITIENIRRYSGSSVFAYLDTRNPGIMALADGCRLGELDDCEAVVEYAREENIDLVLVTTASPLESGLADWLAEAGIRVFGPCRDAARLETDKAYTRNLLDRHEIDAIPGYEVFSDIDSAVEFARERDWKVAVKPIGLTDGLGVKVYGDQLETADDVTGYIKKICEEKISGSGRVIVEDMLDGEEFTVQCLVNGELVVPTPAVQDFKKLLPGGEGPNTASMGSYAGPGTLLPFMRRSDYDRAVEIIRKTLAAFGEENNTECLGFLYGQFMITARGVRLIEYNFRPGDPEWMNTLTVLEEDIASLVSDLLDGRPREASFANRATVCNYIVPEDYPTELNQPLAVSIDDSRIREEGVSFYYSGGLDDNGHLEVGKERGIAFIAEGDTIEQARQKVHRAIATVEGSFYFRDDIGSPELIQTKIRHLSNLRGPELEVREAEESEFMELHRFISRIEGLESYPAHLYRIMLRYCGNTCFIGEIDGEPAAAVNGLLSQRSKGTYFLWQIGTAQSFQGKGIGSTMLQRIELKLRKMGCGRIELTIDPGNEASRKLFEKNGYNNISRSAGDTVEVNGFPAVRDYYSPGRHFMVYEKKL